MKLLFSCPWLHSRSINLLRNVLSTHDFDQRLLKNDEKLNRTRVAALYLPLIHIISNNIHKLFDPGNASFGLFVLSFDYKSIELIFTAGQLNRPSINNSEDLLSSNVDEFVTETDGTLVKNKKQRILFENLGFFFRNV